eukprot:5506679-Alexandrium_andersonii.AAC.1
MRSHETLRAVPGSAGMGRGSCSDSRSAASACVPVCFACCVSVGSAVRPPQPAPRSRQLTSSRGFSADAARIRPC